MIINHVGERCYTEYDLIHHLMVNGEVDFDQVYTTAESLNPAAKAILDKPPNLLAPTPESISKAQYDAANQTNWLMPDEYKNLDIVQHILDLCKSEAELQRVGQELLLYQEYGLFDMLRYLTYLVDTMRKNDIIWGVGRGSSVASYVLYLIGVHRINSLYYDLPIEEFLKINTHKEKSQ